MELDISVLGVSWKDSCNGIEWASAQGFDAIALSDFSLALYCAERFPTLPLHFIAQAVEYARTATFLKLQLNAARIVISHAVSPAQLIEITTSAKVEIEVLAAGGAFITNAKNRASDILLNEWTTGEAPCNDPSYSPKEALSTTLQQLPLMTSLGVRAIQVASCNDMPKEVSNVARIWRQALDRCLVEDAWPGGSKEHYF